MIYLRIQSEKSTKEFTRQISKLSNTLPQMREGVYKTNGKQDKFGMK